LESELGISIQHMHLDYKQNAWIGTEHRPTAWKRKGVDGFYVRNGTNVAVEYFGDVFHGHPRLWGSDDQGTDRWNRKYKDLFLDTQNKMRKLQALGYSVYYAWEYDDIPQKTKGSVLRKFVNDLEWK
jgi:hypothetical protein